MQIQDGIHMMRSQLSNDAVDDLFATILDAPKVHSETNYSLTQYMNYRTSSSDFSKFPANFYLARERARKHKIRDRKKFAKGGLLPLFIEKEKLLKYSMSSYFYFDFIEQGIFILLITFLMCGIFDLITIGVYPSPDDHSNTRLSFVYNLSTLNVTYEPAVLATKIILALINLLVIKVYSLRKEKNRIKKYLSQKNFSQNYFSILVQGLPKQFALKDFYDFLALHIGTNPEEKVKNIIVLQDSHEKEALLKLRKKAYISSLNAKTEEEKQDFEKEIERIDELVSQEDQRLAANERFNGSIIVIFQDTMTALQILTKWEELSVPKILLAKALHHFGRIGHDYKKEFQFQDVFVSIEKAGEPFDVIWHNLSKSKVNIFLRTVFASVILWSVVLAYPLMDIVVTNKEPNTAITPETNFLADVWAYTPYTIVIIAINLVVILMINFLSIFLGLRRKSDVEKHKITLKAAFSFASYALLISAKAFIDSTIVDPNTSGETAMESLINTTALLMFYLIFLPQILELLDIEFIYKTLRRKYYLHKRNYSMLSQGDLDNIMKQPYFDFSTRVSNIAQIVFFASTSAPFFPLAPLMAIAALLVATITDRYLILRRCSDWKLLGTNLGMSFSRQYSYNVFVQITGNVLFLMFTQPSTGSLTDYIFIFLFGMIYTFFFVYKMRKVLRHYAYGGLTLPNTKYEVEESKFRVTYEDLYQEHLRNGGK